MSISIKVTNLSKQYRLGTISTGTISHDINRWWARIRKKEDPYILVGQTNRKHEKSVSEYVWALKDINFEINQGDVVGIIGKNGAGKSTLLKILSRVTKPTTGIVRYKGKIASLLEVGTGFHPEMTGRENIYMNGSIMGMTRFEINNRLDEIIEFAGVEKYIETPVKRYSSGMVVRLGFAVAAHLEPEILIVDEVLAVGDAEFQKKAIGKMQDVSKQKGRTVLFVSHNMGAIQNLCNNGILMNEGIIVSEGPIEKVIGNYLSTFVSEQRKIEYRIDEAPGNFEVRLIKAEIKCEKKPIEAGDEVQLHFDFYHCSEEKATYDVTFHLIDEMNNLVFVSSSGNLDGSRVVSRKGAYNSKCIIPKDLLNEGTYTVTRLLYIRNRGQIVHEFRNILCFEVIEKTTGNFGWYGKKEGIVRPFLKWEIQLP